MTDITKQNLKFIDISLGPKGFLIWVFFPALFFILFILTLCMNSLIHIRGVDEALGELIGGAIFSYFLFRVSCALIFAFKSAQEIIVHGDYLYFRSFLGHKSRFHIDTLLEVTYLKNNWLITESPIFKVGGEHMELLLKPKSKVYIGDNIEGYSELKVILLTKTNQSLKQGKQELNFVDHVYGKKGRQIWLTIPCSMFFTLFFLGGIVSFSVSSLTFIESIMIIWGMLLATAMILLSLRTIFLATKTAQKVCIYSDSIKVRFFSGRIKRYLLTDIESIRELKNTWFLTEGSNIFMKDKSHLLITLHNNEKIYMSENLERYGELKLTLFDGHVNHRGI
ncbi:hypothetical protein [Legionella genomosp. 1]|uniref:hypothetical protein n=1 Tax=Legionella genomosp. 1 TaxID=1093625 RepID=UPI0010545319|nr:hypothetical protein [Legionella genomosp. 1]